MDMGLGNMLALLTSGLSRGFLSKIEFGISNCSTFLGLFMEKPRAIFLGNLFLLRQHMGTTHVLAITIFMSPKHCRALLQVLRTRPSRNGMSFRLISNQLSWKNCLGESFVIISVFHTDIWITGRILLDTALFLLHFTVLLTRHCF